MTSKVSASILYTLYNKWSDEVDCIFPCQNSNLPESRIHLAEWRYSRSNICCRDGIGSRLFIIFVENLEFITMKYVRSSVDHYGIWFLYLPMGVTEKLTSNHMRSISFNDLVVIVGIVMQTCIVSRSDMTSDPYSLAFILSTLQMLYKPIKNAIWILQHFK